MRLPGSSDAHQSTTARLAWWITSFGSLAVCSLTAYSAICFSSIVASPGNSRLLIFREDQQPVHGHHALALGLDDEGIHLGFRHAVREVRKGGKSGDRSRQCRGVAPREPPVAADDGEALHFLDHAARFL